MRVIMQVKLHQSFMHLSIDATQTCVFAIAALREKGAKCETRLGKGKNKLASSCSYRLPCSLLEAPRDEVCSPLSLRTLGQRSYLEFFESHS